MKEYNKYIFSACCMCHFNLSKISYLHLNGVETIFTQKLIVNSTHYYKESANNTLN